MRLPILTTFFLLLSINITGFAANEALFREQLVRIVHELNAIKPIIEEAKKYQSKSSAIQFHLTRFKDANNQSHNGLIDDIELIKKGIIAYLNKPVIAPRKVSALEGDFIETPKKEVS